MASFAILICMEVESKGPWVEDKGSYILKQESARLPEAEKYIALNALGAPVVKLLDIILRNGKKVLVLEKAEPMNLDMRMPANFKRLVSFLADFASMRPTNFPSVDWGYLSEYWSVTKTLVSMAQERSSLLYDPRLIDCTSPDDIFVAYKQFVLGDKSLLTHGDPTNLNLGFVGGKIVAFDLELTWIGDPFRDIVLRTGASTMPFPEPLSVQDVITDYLEKTNLLISNPLDKYRLVGAIYGSYIERHAITDIQALGLESPHIGWAKITLERYIHFTSHHKIDVIREICGENVCRF